MKSHPSASAVIHACTGDAAAPSAWCRRPTATKTQRPWWAQLTPIGQIGPRVIARLPVVTGGDAQPAAYAIGTLEPEPTGADTTLIMLEAARRSQPHQAAER